MSITALSGDTIEKRGLVTMQDYLTILPSVSYIEIVPGDNRIVIRGLSVGIADQQGTTGAYLGEMPMGSSYRAVADISLVDIERVEVLRGPQGTLYGSSALGGTVRNIPIAPNLQNVEGNLKVDVGVQSESDDFNNSFEGVLNIPLIEDQMALRMVAYNHETAGYVDVISTQRVEDAAALVGATVLEKEDFNSTTTTGFRASLLWEPTENIDLTLTLGTQEREVDGAALETVGVDGYTEYEVSHLNLGNVGENDVDYKNLVINYDLGWAKLTSSTSQIDIERNTSINAFPVVFDFGDFLSALTLSQSEAQDILTQEIRLASSLDGPLQFLGGVFYEDVEIGVGFLDTWDATVAAQNPFGARLVQDLLGTTSYKQKAFFGEVSYQFNEQWLLTLGGRHFDYDRDDEKRYTPDADGNFGVFASPDVNGIVDTTSDTGQTYKANVSYTPNEDTHLYAQWAEGFRIGRGQSLPPAETCDVEDRNGNPGPDGILDGSDGELVNTVDPDTTDSFELGAKLSLLDSRLSVNTALFRTDWKDLPVTILDGTDACLFGRVVNNIGEARSEGVELEASFAVGQGLTVNLSGSYIEAEFTAGRVGTSTVEVGDSLMFTPHVNASLGFQYDFDMGSNPSFVRTDMSYVGEYETGVNETSPPGGDYVMLNLRVGTVVDRWSLDFYVDNLTNENATLAYNAFSYATRVRPRRMGAALSYKF